MAQRINNDENRKAEWEADRACLKAISCEGNEREDA